MDSHKQIIELYSELAENPHKNFGWDKGLENAKAHGYKEEWIKALPHEIWKYCAAVGNPFNEADIEEGDTVLDLGCGAGVDVLVARLLVGKTGKVYGVDITPKMVETASKHAKMAGFDNVEILESSFDNVMLEDESVDVVISNGAINLTSCKESVFAEIYRVLKPNGKIYFADMIDISEPSCCTIEQSSCCASSGEEDWANCVAGTLHENELIELIQKAGFKEVECTGYTHYTTAETTKGATFSATKIPADVRRENHWDGLFQNTDYTQVLWHQSSPQKSVELIEKYVKDEANIIDIGSGASYLVDHLLQNGYKNITLLDTSKTALEIVRSRIKNENVQLICSDILHFKNDKRYDLWHDRAAFHFLLSKKEREQYFKVLENSLEPKGIAVISTFKVNGPIQCAGLDIVQYNHQKMLEELPSDLTLIESEEFTHVTPKETTQEYIYFVIQKK
ncbi:methyltransferase domain-containing protein [Sulfurovum sp. XTW-4]|uniref:Methyltransferase domain-containing protein n=1 Tax=Sulfurovum xiamenensis TaxID=3019066 RepID=A0ABT7QU02_9BACT|nr:class I SAM-dependent methyltransferase [Sulfurovum xiamenensis]MDM5264404.1 methyltransferase domain-containing protein [Sulfurovum xiamenensis]